MERSLSQIRAHAFFAADHAVSENGKLYVNGGFYDILQFRSYPAVLPTLGIGAALDVPWHAYQADHQFVISMTDADRQELPLRIEGSFRVGADLRIRHGDPSVFTIGVTVTNVVIELPGQYKLRLSVDNEPLAEWPLKAVQVAFGTTVSPSPPSPAADSE
jgi:hypothetical protein